MTMNWKILAFAVAGTLVLVVLTMVVGDSVLPLWFWPLASGLLWAGALFLSSSDRFTPDRNDQATEETQMVEHAVTDLVGHVEGHLATLVDEMRKELLQIQELVADAVVTLQQAFHGLNQKSGTQSDVVGAMLTQIRRQTNEGMAASGFAEQTDEVLRCFVDYVVETSSSSMAMVDRVDELSEHMGHVDKLLADVKTIADQTNLLALNAAIEAARAGDAGRGFAVVADEVRSLSKRSNRFNDEIRTVIGDALKSIDGARESISGLASKDMNFAIQAKSRVNETLEQLTELNVSVEHTLGSVAQVNSEIDQLANDAVRSLQFEDIVRQLAAYSERHLDRIHGLVGRIHGGLIELRNSEQRAPMDFVLATQQLQAELDGFIGDQRAADRKPVAQESMTQGDVELF